MDLQTYSGDLVGSSDMDAYAFELLVAARVRVTLFVSTTHDVSGDMGYDLLRATDGGRVLTWNLPTGNSRNDTVQLSAGVYGIFMGIDTDAQTNHTYTLTVEIVS